MRFFKAALLWSIILFLPSRALSQTKLLDSLFAAAANAEYDIERIHLYNDIAGEFIESNPAKMMLYAQKALKLSQLKKLKEEEGTSWFNVGNANVMQSRYADALKSYTNAQQLFEQLLKEKSKNNSAIKDKLAITYGSIGVVCSEQNNYARALEFYFKALKLHEYTRQEEYMAHTYNNIGTVYKGQKEYSKALEYYYKALWLQKKIGDETLCITLTNIGAIQLLKNEPAKALGSFKEAEKILQKFDNKRALGELYNNYGEYYLKINNHTLAEQSYKKALSVYEALGEDYGVSAALGYLGMLYASLGKDAEAIQHLEKSSAIAKKIKVPEQVKESEKSLSDIYEKLGNAAEALQHFKKYTEAKEAINNADNIKAMVRAEMNYEFERKEALQKLQAEKRKLLYDEESKRHRLQILFTSLFVILLLGLTFLVYNRRQLKKTLTLQRDLAEYEQKALHLQMNPHFVFNCLGSISSFIVQNGTDSAIKYLSKFSKLMRLTLEYSKESLIPIDKEIESLQNYLELEQLRFNKVFDFSITKDAAIEDDMAIPPLLLQPFVENAIIHGLVPKKQHGMIAVDFRLHQDMLVCTVTDNGIGIDKSRQIKENSVNVHKSMALEITRKRLEVIQAITSKTSRVEINELTDDGGEPIGTKIILHLPIQYTSD